MPSPIKHRNSENHGKTNRQINDTRKHTQLYAKKLSEKILRNKMSKDEKIDVSWNKLQIKITQAASKSLGTRNATTNKTMVHERGQDPRQKKK